MLNSTRQTTGYTKKATFQVNVMPSRKQNNTNTTMVRPKLISACTFLENKNKYFGTLTLVKIPALLIRDCMPCPVDSLKKEKIRLPQNR